MQRFVQAWERIRDDPLPWVISCTLLTVLSGFTWGLGLLLMPNLLRTMNDALDEGGAPEFSKVFDFEALGDDILAMMIWLIALSLGTVIGVVLVLLPMILLFWVPMLAADRSFEGLDAAKASLAHTKGQFAEVALFVLMTVAINFIGVITCVGWLATGPITLLAGLMYFREEREAILAAASSEGIGS